MEYKVTRAFFFFLILHCYSPLGLVFDKVLRGPQGLTDARENTTPFQRETQSFHACANAGCWSGAPFSWALESFSCWMLAPPSQRQSVWESLATVCSVWLCWAIREDWCAVLFIPTLALMRGAMQCAVTSEVLATVLLAVASLQHRAD